MPDVKVSLLDHIIQYRPVIERQLAANRLGAFGTDFPETYSTFKLLQTTFINQARLAAKLIHLIRDAKPGKNDVAARVFRTQILSHPTVKKFLTISGQVKETDLATYAISDQPDELYAFQRILDESNYYRSTSKSKLLYLVACYHKPRRARAHLEQLMINRDKRIYELLLNELTLHTERILLLIEDFCENFYAHAQTIDSLFDAAATLVSFFPNGLPVELGVSDQSLIDMTLSIIAELEDKTTTGSTEAFIVNLKYMIDYELITRDEANFLASHERPIDVVSSYLNLYELLDLAEDQKRELLRLLLRTKAPEKLSEFIQQLKLRFDTHPPFVGAEVILAVASHYVDADQAALKRLSELMLFFDRMSCCSTRLLNGLRNYPTIFVRVNEWSYQLEHIIGGFSALDFLCIFDICARFQIEHGQMLNQNRAIEELSNFLDARWQGIEYVPNAINVTQSTHTASVHLATDLSVWLLDTLYPDVSFLLAPVQTGIEAFDPESCTMVTNVTGEKIAAASRALKRLAATSCDINVPPEQKVKCLKLLDCIDNLRTHPAIQALRSRLESDAHTETTMTLTRFMGLLYKSACDESPSMDAQTGIFEGFINALYEVQRGYNLDELGRDNKNARDAAICFGGTANKHCEALSSFSPFIQFLYVRGSTMDQQLKQIVVDGFTQHVDALHQRADEGSIESRSDFIIIIDAIEARSNKPLGTENAGVIFMSFWEVAFDAIHTKMVKKSEVYRLLYGDAALDKLMHAFPETSLKWFPDLIRGDTSYTIYNQNFRAWFEVKATARDAMKLEATSTSSNKRPAQTMFQAEPKQLKLRRSTRIAAQDPEDTEMGSANNLS